MSTLVPSDQVEQIVGTTRRAIEHVAIAVSAEQRVYILHSHDCRAEYADLRECPYSLALDSGRRSHPDDWRQHEDRPVVVDILSDAYGYDWLVPACVTGANPTCAVDQ